MNKVLLSLNVVLILASGYIILSKGDSKKVTDQEVTHHNSSSNYNIAYVNSDSIWANYEFVQFMKDELAAEKLKLEGQYNYQMKKLEEEVIEFQQKAQYMSIQDGTARENELMQRQQELMQLQEQLNYQFMESEQEKNKVLYDSIANYIEQYSKQNNLQFVFGYNLTGSMFYGADTLNITNTIVDALNERYAKSQKAS